MRLFEELELPRVRLHGRDRPIYELSILFLSCLHLDITNTMIFCHYHEVLKIMHFSYPVRYYPNGF